MQTILIFSLGLIVFIAFILLGLRIPAPIRPPQVEETSEVKNEPLAPHLPTILYESGDNAIAPHPETAIVWGNGKIIGPKAPLLGQLWIPISWTLYLKPGHAFVWRASFTWFRSTKMSGGDEWRNGSGRFVMGDTKIENENMDRGEATMLWLYSLAFTPTALLFDPELTWETVNENCIFLRQPYKNETWEYKLAFSSPDERHLTRVDTHRTASRDGQSMPYHIELDQYHRYNTLEIPGRLTAAWNDEPPFLYLNIAGVIYNASIDAALRRGILDEDVSDEDKATSNLVEANPQEEPNEQ